MWSAVIVMMLLGVGIAASLARLDRHLAMAMTLDPRQYLVAKLRVIVVVLAEIGAQLFRMALVKRVEKPLFGIAPRHGLVAA